MKVTEAIPIFYSTTAHASPFDQRRAFQAVCEQVGQANNVAVHIVDWKKNVAGGIGQSSGQDVIDKEIKRAYDIYFGCLGTRYGKGTIREFENAVSGHIESNEPKEVLFGFDECPINPYLVDSSFTRVRRFRKSIESASQYGRAILYFSFSNEDEFRRFAFLNVDISVKRVLTRVPGGFVIRGR